MPLAVATKGLFRNTSCISCVRLPKKLDLKVAGKIEFSKLSLPPQFYLATSLLNVIHKISQYFSSTSNMDNFLGVILTLAAPHFVPLKTTAVLYAAIIMLYPFYLGPIFVGIKLITFICFAMVFALPAFLCGATSFSRSSFYTVVLIMVFGLVPPVIIGSVIFTISDFFFASFDWILRCHQFSRKVYIYLRTVLVNYIVTGSHALHQELLYLFSDYCIWLLAGARTIYNGLQYFPSFNSPSSSRTIFEQFGV
jgi:hypothetical protein